MSVTLTSVNNSDFNTGDFNTGLLDPKAIDLEHIQPLQSPLSNGADSGALSVDTALSFQPASTTQTVSYPSPESSGLLEDSVPKHQQIIVEPALTEPHVLTTTMPNTDSAAPSTAGLQPTQTARTQPDSLAPTVGLWLREDTGYSNTDHVTAVPPLTGKVTATTAIANLVAYGGTQTLDEAVTIKQSLQVDGSFVLEADQLSAVLDTPLSAGTIDLRVVATDALGQSSTPTAIRFMFIADTPEISQVYAVREDVLTIEIVAGQTQPGRQRPFTLGPTDQVEAEGGSLWVTRNGIDIGALVGRAQDTLYTFDKFVGTSLDIHWADQADSYIIRPDDSATEDAAAAWVPDAVFRKSKPINMARVGRWDYEWPMKHTVYLDLPAAMAAGETYTIELPDSEFKPISYLHRPDLVRSEAVHVSQVGFRPDDPVKVGYLSTWAGNGGGLFYANGQTFWIVDDDTDEIVYGGQSTLARPMYHEDAPRGRDHPLTEVHRQDFSEFDQAGRFRLCVDGIGCSFSFEITETTWQSAFYTAARGFYHQRSGIALEAPYTDYTRPRAFHPDDGLKVYQSKTTVMDTTKGIGEAEDFETLVRNRTETLVSDVWGGYFDAGDWDRHIQHLQVSRSLLELADLFPTYFADLDLNIPESGNAIPDIIDEALWSLDFFFRLQTADGGIPGGVESAEHPRWGEASWQESLTVMMYAPDLWSSYIYAGVAARAAHVLADIAPQRAATYRTSALQAMAYAEAEYANLDDSPFQVRDERNLAALELFRLTGDDGWHDIFLATTVFTAPDADTYIYDEHL